MQRLLITTGIYAPHIGGPATHAALIAKGLASDYTVTVLTYSRWMRAVPQPFRFLLFLAMSWRASRNADLTYALSPLGTGVATACIGKPFIVRVAGDRAWEDAVNKKRTSLLIDDFQKVQHRGFKHRLQVWVCKKARAVVVPSEYLASIVAGWGIEQGKIKIVPNAVEHVVAEPLNEIHGKLIVSIGRLVPWKGFRMLIKLMPQLLEINPFFRLIIIGNGPDMPVLQTMIRNMNLQNKVYLVGKKTSEEAARYLAAAQLFVLNTGYEGFSHTLLEAMAAGVPVITTSAGGNRELIRQGENGFMVKYNDEFNLLEAIKTLSKDAELREHFIVEGKKTAAQYTPERTIRETKNVLNLLR